MASVRLLAMTTDDDGYQVVADVVRNEFVEGSHWGRLLIVDAEGNNAVVRGDVARPIHPRSANKLMQAAGMLELGLDLNEAMLALAAASHWGQDKHVSGARTILHDSGLDESALGCPPSLPSDSRALEQAMRSGTTPAPIFNGCSGKHAAMLRTCVINNWPVESYLDTSHPLQVSLRQAVTELARTSIAHTAVDGCGAPAWAIPLTSLVDVYRRAASPHCEEPTLREVATAVRQFPEYVCGDESEVTGLMRAIPGLLAKDGAESVYVAALPDGRAVGVKIADGGFRAGRSVLVAALRWAGVEQLPGVDVDALRKWGTVEVTGHGVPVGAVLARPLG